MFERSHQYPSPKGDRTVSRKALGDRFNYVTARGFADNLRTRK
ncbi:hypothetical protein [Nostoc sp. WHI]|nr:hypothetical protein [Nostoc sp. WHI]